MLCTLLRTSCIHSASPRDILRNGQRRFQSFSRKKQLPKGEDGDKKTAPPTASSQKQQHSRCFSMSPLIAALAIMLAAMSLEVQGPAADAGAHPAPHTLDDYRVPGSRPASASTGRHPTGHTGPSKPTSTSAAGSTIAFTVEGHAPTRLSYAFISLKMDLGKLRQQVTEIETALYNIKAVGPYDKPHEMDHSPDGVHEHLKWPIASHNEGSHELKAGRARLITLRSRIDRIAFLLTPTNAALHKEIMGNLNNHTDFLMSHPSRQVRAVPFIAIAGTVAATLGLVWTARELLEQQRATSAEVPPQLHRQVLHDQVMLGHTEVELATIARNTIEAFKHSYADMQTTQFLHIYAAAAETRIRMLEDALEAAAQGHISVQALMEFDFGATMVEMARKARSRGQELLSTHFTDWLQYEASFVATEVGFDILLHVPLAARQTMMTIHRFHPLPIALDDHLHLQFRPGTYTHLSISADRTIFRAMTQAEFNTCRRVGPHLLCDLGTVARRSPPIDLLPTSKDPELCLFALYTRRFQLATRVCETDVVTAPDVMVMLSPNTFAYYTTRPQAAHIRCPHGTPTTSEVSVVNTTVITIPFGCIGVTDTFTFGAADASFSRPASEWRSSYDWPAAVRDITDGVDSKAIQNLVKDSDHVLHMASRVSLRTATDAKELASAEAEAWNSHRTITPAIATLLAIATGCYTAYLHFRLNSMEARQVLHAPTPLPTYHAGDQHVTFTAPRDALDGPKPTPRAALLHPLLYPGPN